MPFDITCKVNGLDALKDTLDRKAKEAVKSYLRKAAKSAAEIWVKAIVENAPRNTGFLAEHIAIATRYTEASTKLELHVGPEKSAFYGVFDEFGTRFMAAHPFMRPAFEEHKEEVMQAFAEAAKVSLEEVAA
jgi:HK97 gp10 family phage protein